MSYTNNFSCACNGNRSHLCKALVYIFTFFTVFLCFSNHGYTASTNTQDSLSIGYFGNPPFVIDKANAKTRGISIDIWHEVSREANIYSSVNTYHDIDTLFSDLEKGILDLLVGPITINSDRLKKYTYTVPYYKSDLAIMAKRQERSLWQRIQPFFSKKFFQALLGFLIVLSIVGTLLWLAERKNAPEQFSSHPLSGIGDGIWLAIVTMTTVGYGDKSPTTTAGKIIAASWMVVSLIMATSLVAGIASTLSLSASEFKEINVVEDIANKKVGIISRAYSMSLAQDYQAETIFYDDIYSAYNGLKNDEIKAIVFERPQLKYFINKTHNEQLYILEKSFYSQYYAFLALDYFELMKTININILELLESNRIEDISSIYMGDN